MRYNNKNVQRMFEKFPFDETVDRGDGNEFYLYRSQNLGGWIIHKDPMNFVSGDKLSEDEIDEAWREVVDVNKPNEQEPEDDDFIVTDKYWVNQDIGQCTSYIWALKLIQAKMQADSFWPNVWLIGERGDMQLIPDLQAEIDACI